MNKGIIFTIGLLAGVAGGGIAGFLLGQKKMADECTQSIEELKQYYSDKSKSESNRLAKKVITENADRPADHPPINRVKTPEGILAGYDVDGSNNEINYSEFTAKKPAEKAVVVDPEETKYVITPDEFDEDEAFEKVTLLYYPEDGILTDTEDELYSIEASIGESNLEEFGKYEPNMLYVRNTDEETDYEIIFKTGMSFADDIAGTV